MRKHCLQKQTKNSKTDPETSLNHWNEGRNRTILGIVMFFLARKKARQSRDLARERHHRRSEMVAISFLSKVASVSDIGEDGNWVVVASACDCALDCNSDRDAEVRILFSQQTRTLPNSKSEKSSEHKHTLVFRFSAQSKRGVAITFTSALDCRTFQVILHIEGFSLNMGNFVGPQKHGWGQ